MKEFISTDENWIGNIDEGHLPYTLHLVDPGSISQHIIWSPNNSSVTVEHIIRSKP